MPTITPLTVEQWQKKILATLPGWFLQDTPQSVLRSHLKGMAAVFRALEESLSAHIDETYIGRCSEEMLNVFASERLIPDLGYTDETRRDQVRDVRSRLHLEGIRKAVSSLLLDETVEVVQGYPTGGAIVLPADYDDNEADVIDWNELTNFFSVIVGAQILPSDSFLDRESYADRGAYAATADTGVSPITERVQKVVEHYKAAGTRYRIFQRS